MLTDLDGSSGKLGSATNRTGKANTMGWPAIEKISGRLVRLIAAYFNNETASFEEVDSRSTHPAMSPLASRQ